VAAKRKKARILGIRAKGSLLETGRDGLFCDAPGAAILDYELW
jgi:hypothetical protein